MFPRPLLPLLLALSPLAALPAQRIDVAMPAAADATLYHDPAGQLANDAGQNLFLGQNQLGEVRRLLLRFDLAALPVGARIVHAELQLVVAQSALQATPGLPVSVHRVTRSWTEGPTAAAGLGGSGAQAQTNDTTWLHADYPALPWANPGGDYDPQPSGVFPMPTTGVFPLGPSEAIIRDVQRWLDGQAQNHGWLLRTDELALQNARRLPSRESTLVGVQPRLLVGYVAPGTVYARGSGCPGSNALPLHQAIVGAPLVGATVQFTLSNGPPLQPTLTLIAGTFNLTSPQILPGCPYELDHGPLFLLGPAGLDAGGATAYTVRIPAIPLLFGHSLSFQSIALDPLLPPFFLVFSNGELVVFG